MPQIGRSLAEELDLTEAEQTFLEESNTSNTAEGVQARAISDVYVAKKLREATHALIASNEKLAAANGRYALALNILTAALVLATFALVGVTLWSSSVGP